VCAAGLGQQLHGSEQRDHEPQRSGGADAGISPREAAGRRDGGRLDLHRRGRPSGVAGVGRALVLLADRGRVAGVGRALILLDDRGRLPGIGRAQVLGGGRSGGGQRQGAEGDDDGGAEHGPPPLEEGHRFGDGRRNGADRRRARFRRARAR
jgi:hypothetical protein